MNTSLTYSGQLQVETKTKKALARNHGTYHLFRLFSVMLCKEDFTSRNLPTYFMLYKANYVELLDNPDTDIHSNKQLFRVYLDIRSNYSSFEGNIHHANFASVIDSSLLLDSSPVEDGAFLSLAMVTADKKHILAVVDFNKDIYNIIRAGGQALIKWILTVSNSDEAVAEAIANLLEE